MKNQTMPPAGHVALLLLAASCALGAAAEVDRSNEVAIEGAASGDLELHPAAEMDVCTKYPKTSTQAASTLCMGDLATKTAMQALHLESQSAVGELSASIDEAAANALKISDLAGLHLESQSAGYCDGNFFKVWLDGSEVQKDPAAAKGPTRGINAIVIDVDVGAAVSWHSFDTCCQNPNTPSVTPATENQRLRDFIDGLPEGQVVAFGIKDEGAGNLEAATKAALETMGARHVHNVEARESWTMIGVKGLQVGAAREHHGGSEDIDDQCKGGAKTEKVSQFFNTGTLAYLNSERASLAGSVAEAVGEVAASIDAVGAKISSDLAGIHLESQSAGSCDGRFFKVWLDGSEVQKDPAAAKGPTRGINAVVIDVDVGAAVSWHNFDTCCQNANTPSVTPATENQRLRDFIDGLPEGQVVAFGIKDDGVNRLEAATKAALETMGARHVYNVEFRESWTMIGVKGLQAGAAREHHGGSEDIDDTCKGGAKTEKVSQFFNTGTLAYLNDERASLAGSIAEAVGELAAPFLRTVSVQSAGACDGNYYKVWIDQEEVQNDPDHPGHSRGINAIVIDVHAGTAVSRHNFDTCCTHLAKGKTPEQENQNLRDFIDGLPEGQVVVFGIVDEGMNNLEDDSKKALAVMGSSLAANNMVGSRESWSMIGVKRSFAGGRGHAYEHYGGETDQGGCGGGPETKKIDQKFICEKDWCMGNGNVVA